MKKPKNTDKQTVHADIFVTRYEDTGEGHMTAAETLDACNKYMQELIQAKVTGEVDGEVTLSISAMADRIIIHEASIEDNGEEEDGEDIGRWTVSFWLMATFTVQAPDQIAANVKLLEEVEEVISDVMDGSIEEYACDFSIDIVQRK